MKFISKIQCLCFRYCINQLQMLWCIRSFEHNTRQLAQNLYFKFSLKHFYHLYYTVFYKKSNPKIDLWPINPSAARKIPVVLFPGGSQTGLQLCGLVIFRYILLYFHLYSYCQKSGFKETDGFPLIFLLLFNYTNC